MASGRCTVNPYLTAVLAILFPSRGRHRGMAAQPADCPYEICHHNHPERPPWGEAEQPDGAPAEDDDSGSPADMTQLDVPPGRVRRYARPDDSGSPL